MTGIYSASPLYTMVDKSKGSMTNRFDCAKEQFKNNLALGTKLTLATGAGVAIAYKKPGFIIKAAQLFGETAAKLITKLGGNGLAAKILKNPTKYGAAGLIAAAGLWAVNTIYKHTYKAGQIDQKYTDAAAIETQTKKVVLG